jgi:hypothetical protein
MLHNFKLCTGIAVSELLRFEVTAAFCATIRISTFISLNV